MTALYDAAAAGNLEQVQRLLAGPELRSIDWLDANTGETPLHAAARAGNLAIVNALLDRGADPGKQVGKPRLGQGIGEGMSALDISVESRDTAITGRLLRHPHTPKRTEPLLLAIRLGYPGMVQQLLEGGIGRQDAPRGLLARAKAFVKGSESKKLIQLAIDLHSQQPGPERLAIARELLGRFAAPQSRLRRSMLQEQPAPMPPRWERRAALPMAPLDVFPRAMQHPADTFIEAAPGHVEQPFWIPVPGLPKPAVAAHATGADPASSPYGFRPPVREADWHEGTHRAPAQQPLVFDFLAQPDGTVSRTHPAPPALLDHAASYGPRAPRI